MIFSRQKIISNIGALLSGTVIARALSAFTLILIARQLGPASFGQYAASFAGVKVASVGFSLGIDGWLLRNGNRQNNANQLGVHSTSSLAIKIGLGAVWFLTIALLAPLLDQRVFPFSIVILCAIAIWLEDVTNTAWSTFKATLQNHTTFILIIFFQGSIFVITAILAWLGFNSAQIFLTGRIAAAALGSSVALYWMVHRFGIQFRLDNVRHALVETLPYGASLALAMIYGRADIMIVAHWLGKEAAGYYSPAVSLLSMLILIPSATYGVMLPVLSQAHSERAHVLHKYAVKLVLWSALLGAVLGGFLALAARPLMVFLYGEAYASSASILMILSGVIAARAIIFALASIIVAVGWQNRRVIIQVASAALNIGLNVLVVQHWGLHGVAWIYVLSEWILLLGYLWLVIKWTQTDQQPRLENVQRTLTT